MLDFLRQINPILYAIIISVLPFGELRIGIPVAAAANLNLFTSFLLCTAANIAAIPFIYLFLDTIHKLLMKISLYNRIFEKVVHKVRKKVTKYVERWGYFGLLVFVSIPLPGSGAWSGVLGAWLFNMQRKKAMLAIGGGVLIAGILVSLAMAGLVNGIKWLI